MVTRSVTATSVPLPTEALANIRNVDLRSTILSDTNVPQRLRDVLAACAACGLDNPVYTDLTGDGVDDVLAPIYDNDMLAGTVVYSVQEGRPTMVFAYQGRQAALDPIDGDLVLRVRMYAPDDAPCCPSDEQVTRYHWDATQFVEVSQTGGRDGLKPFDPDATVVR